MSLKREIARRGMRLMSDPRVAKIMQNEQVMRAVVAAIGMPGKIQALTQEQAERIAKAARLATAQEVEDLRRTVRALETEVAELRKRGERKA